VRRIARWCCYRVRCGVGEPKRSLFTVAVGVVEELVDGRFVRRTVDTGGIGNLVLDVLGDLNLPMMIPSVILTVPMRRHMSAGG